MVRFAAIGAGVLLLLFLMTGTGHSSLQAFLVEYFPSSHAFLGKVIAVQEEIKEINSAPYWIQTLRIRFITGALQGEESELHNQGKQNADPSQKVSEGETIVVAKNQDFQGDEYYMTDRYRLPALFIIGLLFVAAVIAFGGMRGISSLLGLCASIVILVSFVVPHILAGENALLVSFVGAVAIAFLSLYLAHGVNARTTIALAGTLMALLIALVLTLLFTSMAHLIGLASEETFYLYLNVGTINLRGLLLGGIIIGMLGVLDDVTIGQAATVYEIKRADPTLGLKELYRRGTAVGREHIASLVNTLVLAYAGASFPLFLVYIVQSDKFPLWLALNSEPVAEEVVRTLVGSMSLIFAVPITTFLAAYYYGKLKDQRI